MATTRILVCVQKTLVEKLASITYLENQPVLVPTMFLTSPPKLTKFARTALVWWSAVMVIAMKNATHTSASTTVAIVHSVFAIHGHRVPRLCNVIHCSTTVAVISNVTEKIVCSTVSIASNTMRSARKDSRSTAPTTQAMGTVIAVVIRSVVDGTVWTVSVNILPNTLTMFCPSQWTFHRTSYGSSTKTSSGCWEPSSRVSVSSNSTVTETSKLKLSTQKRL